MSTDTNWKIARNEGVVRAFLKGWDNRDVDACMALCTDDMCYLNQPLEAIRGKANVCKMIASIFGPAKKVEFRLLNVLATATKLLPSASINGTGTVAVPGRTLLPVGGMFELTEDGKMYRMARVLDNEQWSKNGGPSLILE